MRDSTYAYIPKGQAEFSNRSGIPRVAIIIDGPPLPQAILLSIASTLQSLPAIFNCYSAYKFPQPLNVAYKRTYIAVVALVSFVSLVIALVLACLF